MPYNMQTYSQEVALRLSRYQASLELDPGSLEVIINRARRDVQMATLNLFPERYAAIIQLDTISGNSATEVVEYRTTVTRYGSSITNKVYSMDLPDDFIQNEATLVQYNDEWWEAREVTKAGLYSAMRNQNTMPTGNEPMYCIEKSPDSATYTIYISKGEDAVTPAEVRVYYLKALKHLQRVDSNGNPDAEVAIGYEFEEFVIYQSMLQAMKKSSFNHAKPQIAADFEQGLLVTEQNYNATVDRQGLLLPGREGLYPNQPVQVVPNNSIMPDFRDPATNAIA